MKCWRCGKALGDYAEECVNCGALAVKSPGTAMALSGIGWLMSIGSLIGMLALGVMSLGNATTDSVPLAVWADLGAAAATGVLFLGFATLLQQVAEIKAAVAASIRKPGE